MYGDNSCWDYAIVSVWGWRRAQSVCVVMLLWFDGTVTAGSSDREVFHTLLMRSLPARSMRCNRPADIAPVCLFTPSTLTDKIK